MQKGIPEILDTVFPQASRAFKISLILLLAGFAAYANAIQHPFVHDDVVFILQNPDIENLKGVWSVFTQPFWLAPQTSVINPYHRPLLEVVYRLEYALFGLYPQGYHFLNILLHIANGFLLFAVLERLFKRTGLALTVSLIFLVHPVQSEAVACISGISNLLSGFFVLMSFNLFLQRESAQRSMQRIFLAVGSVAFFVLALLAKEQVIILPFILILYQWLLAKEIPGRPAREKYLMPGLLVLAAGAFILLRKFSVGQGVPNVFANPLELGMRLHTIPETLVTYMRLLVWPSDLHYYRSIDTLSSSLWTPFVFGIIVLTAGWIVLKTPQPRKNILIFSAGWFIVFLLPVLNILPLIIEYSHITTAEHFLYLPMVGAVIFVVTLLNDRRFFNGWLVVVVCAVLTLLTLKQNTYWRSEVVLFERTVQYEKKMARIYLLLAKAYFFDDQIDKSIEAYHKAASIVEQYLRAPLVPAVHQYYRDLARGIYLDMAYCYQFKGDSAQAGRYLQAAQKLHGK